MSRVGADVGVSRGAVGGWTLARRVTLDFAGTEIHSRGVQEEFRKRSKRSLGVVKEGPKTKARGRCSGVVRT